MFTGTLWGGRCAVDGAVFVSGRTLSPSSAVSWQLPSDEKLSSAADFLRFQNLIAGTELTSAKFPHTDFLSLSRPLQLEYGAK